MRPLCLAGILSLTDCSYANDTVIGATHWRVWTAAPAVLLDESEADWQLQTYL